MINKSFMTPIESPTDTKVQIHALTPGSGYEFGLSRKKRVGYKLLIRSVLLFLVLSQSIACKDPDPPDTGDEYLEFQVLGKLEYQEITGFGASDAWSCQLVGKNWPESKKNQIADWLFSRETADNGDPAGIGLQIWRFNIGAGSAEQGANSGINDPWRRAESFLNSDGSFDGSSQVGQRWFLRAARARGVDQFVGFVNSPPVAFSKNGKAWSSSASSYNLDPQHYTAYAEYLADVTAFLEQTEGIVFDRISPFNEPQWDWNSGGQEGTPAQNTEIAEVTREINRIFQQRGLSSRIEIPEAAQLQFLFSDNNKPGRGDQLNAFFDPASDQFIGDLSHVENTIAGHSYYSTWPLNDFVGIRRELSAAITDLEIPVDFQMTEYCVLENNDEIRGNGRDLGMNTALYVARVVHTDLVVAGATSWQWWLGLSPYDYKDGLVFIDKDAFDGNVYDSKTLWTLGHFSRFIHPGMIRLGITRSDLRQTEQTLNGLMASAFVSADSLKFTMVLINYSQNIIPVKLSFSDLPVFTDLHYYLTSSQAAHNLSHQGTFTADELYEMPPRSIVTITNVE
jgi:O-glycosyl hydrolase